MIAPASASASSSARGQDFFALQAEKHRAVKAKESEAAALAEATEVAKWLDTYALDNETFVALGASDPTMPARFLKTSAGINHFFQRFFLETTIISDRDNLKMLAETEAWRAALKERGGAENPVDLELKNMWLSDARIEELGKLLPNVRSIAITGYVYDNDCKTKQALDIQELLKARFPKLKKVTMTDGYVLPDMKKQIDKVQPALAVYDLTKGLKRADEMRLYFPNITHADAQKLYREVQTTNIEPKIKFCRNNAINIALSDLLAKKSPLLKKIEPISITIEAAGEKPAAAASNKPVDDSEWAAPNPDEWAEVDGSKAAAEASQDDWA